MILIADLKGLGRFQPNHLDLQSRNTIHRELHPEQRLIKVATHLRGSMAVKHPPHMTRRQHSMKRLRLSMVRKPLNTAKSKLLRSMAKANHQLSTAKVSHQLSTAKVKDKPSMARDSSMAHPLNTGSTQRDHNWVSKKGLLESRKSKSKSSTSRILPMHHLATPINHSLSKVNNPRLEAKTRNL